MTYEEALESASQNPPDAFQEIYTTVGALVNFSQTIENLAILIMRRDGF